MAERDNEQHHYIDESPKKERTPEQKVFDDLMFRLDLLKFSPELKVDGENQAWSKVVKLSQLENLSSEASAFLDNAKRLTLFVEFNHGEERRVGLRSNSREVAFVLNKGQEACLVQKGERTGRLAGQWSRVQATDIPIGDAFVMTSEKVLNFRL